MMTLKDIIDALNLKLFTKTGDLSSITPLSGYATDMLSCAMTGAKAHSIWVTLQSHANIVAIATLLDLSAVIITEGAIPEADTITKANEQGVILLGTEKNTFATVGKLWELGLRD